MVYTTVASCFILTGTYLLIKCYSYIKNEIVSTAVSDFALLGVYLFWISIFIILPLAIYYFLANGPIKDKANLNIYINATLNIVMFTPTIFYSLSIKNPFN